MLNPRWLDDISTRTDLLTKSDARKSWRFRNRKLRNLLGGAYSACAEISEGIVVHGSDAKTFREEAAREPAEIPRHSTYLLPGVKHFTFEDAPEATVENFRAWWANLETNR